jgi:uncharacterized protein (DUF1499 family)
MKKSRAIATGLAGAALGYGLWRAWESGVARVWQGLFGSPDLGPVDFGTLERRGTPNDSLAAPRDACPRATPDFEPPAYPVPAERLRPIVSAVIAEEPDTALLHGDGDQVRYLVRTRLLRFPDTVDVKVIDLGEGCSTLALYSRSQIGRSDLGTNQRRLRRWIDRVSRSVAAERSGSGS